MVFKTLSGMFCIALIISGVMVISAVNPVHSVLWLVGVYMCGVVLFISLEVDFLAFMFLIVYVGAIAILFLFVIMMLNLTDLKYLSDMSNYMLAGFIIGMVIYFEVLVYFRRGFRYLSGGAIFVWTLTVILDNIRALGGVLYTGDAHLFVFASWILLVAMGGVIILTFGGARLRGVNNIGNWNGNRRRSYRKDHLVVAPLNNLLVDLPAPTNLNYWWNMGSLLGLSFLVQVVTGVFIAMHYCSEVELAFRSVEHMVRDVNYGFALRYLHANGASIFFLCVYLHIGRGLYYGGYRGGLVWHVGVLIFLLMIVTAFMGYVLPWGQMSYWAATVITNLLSAVPYMGGELVRWVWGGFSVSNATLNRFLSLHYVLPFLLMGLVGIHLIALHELGSSNPVGVGSDLDKVEFHYYYGVKDAYGGVIIVGVLCGLVFWNPYALGDVENFKQADALVTPVHIKPEWYFLFVYAILRSVPNKFGGVVALVLSVVVLFVLPYVHVNRFKGVMFRPLGKVLFWLLVGVFLMLTWLGGQPVEEPYTWVGQMAAVFYFLLYLVCGPAGDVCESRLMGL